MQREILLAYLCDDSNCEGRWNKLTDFLGNKLKGNSPIGTILRRRQEDNIKNGFSTHTVGGSGMTSSDLGERQITGSCAHGNEPSVSINCGELLDYLTEN